MELNAKLEKTIRNYLLGGLSQAEQEELEERLMIEDDAFTQLLVHEDELIDEYIQGALSAQEAEAFESHFLSAPERRQKLGFARTLTKYAAVNAKKGKQSFQTSFAKSIMPWLRLQHPVTQFSLAAAAIVMTLGVSWSTLSLWRLKDEVEQMRVQQITVQTSEQNLKQQLAEEQSRNQNLTEQLQQQQQTRATLEEQVGSLQRPITVAFALAPGLVRDFGAMKKLAVPPAAMLVQLSLSLEGENYQSYRARLDGASGEEVISQNRLALERREGNAIAVVTIPARLLAPGDYIVKLSGMKSDGSSEDIGKYYFRVSRK